MTLSLRPTNYSSRWKILIQIILKLINKNRCIWKIKTVKIDKKYYKWIPARVATTTNYSRVSKLASCPSGVSNQQEIAENNSNYSKNYSLMAARRTSDLGSGAWWQPVWAAWNSWLGNSKTFRQQVGFWEERDLRRLKQTRPRFRSACFNCSYSTLLTLHPPVQPSATSYAKKLKRHCSKSHQHCWRHLVNVEEISKNCWMSHWLHLRRMKWWC